jgi:pyruvate dehydrogenase E2 component (dihydrolipoamide acetyltransferase)
MEREFKLPDLGSGLKEGEIVRWLVKPGDEVTTDDLLCEVETEKAVIEVPVPYDGTVSSLAVDEGESVAVGSVLATFETGQKTSPESESESADQEAAQESSPVAEPPVATAVESAKSPSEHAETERARAMPAVRRIARKHDVDIRQIAGSGRDEHVTKGDVLAWLRQQQSKTIASGGDAPAASSGEERIRLPKLRKTIAERMVQSWREIPHVFTRIDVRADGILEVKATLSDLYNKKVPVEALLIRAALPALRAHPEFNATLEGDELVLHKAYNISIAVDTDEGLVLPTVQGADAMSMRQLTDHLNDLLSRAVSRKASPDELSGGTFTVNNIGALGLIKGTSIIPYGTTAILSVGRAVETAVVIDGKVQVMPMVEVTLSFDHRVIDGGMAQSFLNDIKRNIEEAARLLA